MAKLQIPSLLLLFPLLWISTQATNSITPPQPHILNSLEIQNKDEEALTLSRSCSYTVIIKTSCSSTRFTRDMISMAFGEAYGYQVYVPRLDDPYSRAFESCSTDTYQISGPCMYRICYLYFARTGYDGWKPESVTIYGYYTKAITFYYGRFLPNGVWFGFNLCNTRSMISSV